MTPMATEDDTNRHADEAQRGLFDGFEGYRTPSRNDYIRVLGTGLIVLDANVLLDLYRYGTQARTDLLSALTAIGDRLWVPHQAMTEFWRNRETVLKDPGGTDSLLKSLENAESQLNENLNSWTKQRSHDLAARSELKRIVSDAFGSLHSMITELSEESTASWARDTGTDEVLQVLEPILNGNVGAPLPSDEYNQALLEARRRADKRIPPGYLDAKKNEVFAAGDYLVWEQSLQEATARGVDMLFISRDTKEDWVRRESGENRGPRLELVDELRQRAGVQLYMQTPAGLLQLAQESLDVSVHEESVSDADRLSKELGSLELRLTDQRWWKDGNTWDTEAVAALMRHLSTIHPQMAELLSFASTHASPIESDLLEFLEMPTDSKSLRQLEHAVVEATEATALDGLLPARAPAVLERLVLRSTGQPPRLVGFKINPVLKDLIPIVSEVDDDGHFQFPDSPATATVVDEEPASSWRE